MKEKEKKENLSRPPMPKTKVSGEKIVRPPVVVVLGHVDHGKTSILDFIRKTHVAEKETGGITQHIGAYEIEHQKKKITFIDTPGHEAFSQMRSRGAKVADIAILVVDASQSIQPQTKEAIYHIKLAQLPMVVALNKIDKPDADPERIKRELSKEDILVESMGGKIPLIEVSAKTGQGINDLLELILLVADLEGPETSFSEPAEGVIIESYLDSFRGPIATLILNQGKLKPGQIIGTPTSLGKIKALEDFQGNLVPEGHPSQPLLLLGFEGIPRVGERFKFFPSTEEAKTYLKEDKKKTLEALVLVSDQKVLNLILKADVLGSLEAIEEILANLPQDKIVLRTLKAEVGEITESDIKLASQAKAKILGFRVKMNPIARIISEKEKIKIMQFDVIYDLVEGIRKCMEKIVEPEIVRVDLGKMRTLVLFMAEKNRQIVGGKIIEGEVKKGVLIEIWREEENMGRGRLINLQKNKKDIDRAQRGEEVGILYEGETKIEQGDTLVFYIEERRRCEL